MKNTRRMLEQEAARLIPRKYREMLEIYGKNSMEKHGINNRNPRNTRNTRNTRNSFDL